MRRFGYIFLCLLVPFLLADAGPTKPARFRGKKAGSYSIVLAGQYHGNGTASINGTTLTFAATVHSGGTTVNFTSAGMTVTNDHFKGTGNLGALPCTIEGRVDLPSATDDQQTDQQALTGRLTATVRDSAGKMARIVGIQDAASRTGGVGIAPPDQNDDHDDCDDDHSGPGPDGQGSGGQGGPDH